MSRPPSRPLRRVLSLGLVGTALAWWGWHAAESDGPEPPRVPARAELKIFPEERRGGDGELLGAVRDAAGAALADVLLVIVSEGRLRSTTSAADGTFRLDGLVEGPHRLAAVAQDRPPRQLDVVVPSAAPIQLVLLDPYAELPALEPLLRRDLVGRVSMPFPGDSAEGFEVLFSPQWSAADLPPLDGRTERRIDVTAEGTFELPALALGTYDVWLLPPFARGGRWPALARVQHDHRAGDTPAEFLLASQHGALEGTLVDGLGDPVEGALVELTDSSRPKATFPPRLTDPEGRFRIPALPAGTWRLTVTAGNDRHERLVRIAALRTERVELAPTVSPAR